MKNSLLTLTIIIFLFSIKSSFAGQKIDTPISPNDLPVEVTFSNQGWYIAEYQLSYNSGGDPVVEVSGPVALGQEVTFLVPSNARDGTVKGQFLTGAVWDPTSDIFEQPFTSDYVQWMSPDGSVDQVLIVTSGSVFNPSFGFQQPPGSVPIPRPLN